MRPERAKGDISFGARLLRSLAYDHKPADVAFGSAADLWLHDYLSQKTKLMQATSGVMNPFGWMRRAVMEDWK